MSFGTNRHRISSPCRKFLPCCCRKTASSLEKYYPSGKGTGKNESHAPIVPENPLKDFIK
jgi:hypothetical protein